jgi:hypothetical protein
MEDNSAQQSLLIASAGMPSASHERFAADTYFSIAVPAFIIF